MDISGTKREKPDDMHEADVVPEADLSLHIAITERSRWARRNFNAERDMHQSRDNYA